MRANNTESTLSQTIFKNNAIFRSEVPRVFSFSTATMLFGLPYGAPPKNRWQLRYWNAEWIRDMLDGSVERAIMTYNTLVWRKGIFWNEDQVLQNIQFLIVDFFSELGLWLGFYGGSLWEDIRACHGALLGVLKFYYEAVWAWTDKFAIPIDDFLSLGQCVPCCCWSSANGSRLGWEWPSLRKVSVHVNPLTAWISSEIVGTWWAGWCSPNWWSRGHLSSRCPDCRILWPQSWVLLHRSPDIRSTF